LSFPGSVVWTASNAISEAPLGLGLILGDKDGEIDGDSEGDIDGEIELIGTSSI